MMTMQKTFLKGIDFYRQKISPHKRACCRFQPTCSEYARIAIERYGATQGAFLALKRLARCQPLCPGGYDPVPEPPDSAIRRDENK